MLECLFNKVAGPTQLFSSKYCEIFKNIYFEKHLRTAASGKYKSNRKKTIRACIGQKKFSMEHLQALQSKGDSGIVIPPLPLNILVDVLCFSKSP